MTTFASTAIATVLMAAAVSGQPVPSQSAPPFSFYYPMPPESAVTVTRGLSYGPGQLELQLPRVPGSAPLPVLVFFYSTPAGMPRNPIWDAWARIAAGNGLAAVLPDFREATVTTDFASLLTYLSTNATRLGLDSTRIVVFAASANVTSALQIVEDPAETRVAAAVMYYGTSPVTAFRRDLPLLLVRAGLDRPPVSREIAQLVARAIEQNAPVTLVNHPAGHHGFEVIDDDAGTRHVIDRTLAFVKEATTSAYLASTRRGVTEATAAAHVTTGQFAEAAARYGELVAARPGDNLLRLSYGEALLGAGRFAAACAEFDKLRGKGLGPRDLGLPAARACLQSGDQAAAIAWLASIPRRFLPDSVQQEAVFEPLRSRPDFQAVFSRR